MRQIVIIVAIAAVLVGLARADFASDKKECEAKLRPLMPCSSYVSGESKSPSNECCFGFRVTIQMANGTKCLCALVNDRDEPSLGLKIVPKYALSLPSQCFVRTNASRCIDLLGLAPNSTEALVFSDFERQFGALQKGGSSRFEAFQVWCLMLTIASTFLLNLSWVYGF